jgi:hypothetical protein
MDVKSAFLNGYLEEEVFLEQPQGFEVHGKEHQVYKLKKALYGLKQAPITWYARIDGYFQDNGFNRSKSEPTLYYKQEGKNILIVSLYVDDLLYMGSSSKMKDEFKIAMMNKFEMKDLGLMQYFLGMEVYQNEDEIFIFQTKYAKDMLKKFDMVDSKPTLTPSSHGIVLCTNDGAEIVDEATYRSIVGSLTVSLVSRYMTEPYEIHMKAAKRILRYVRGTLNFGIHYHTSKRFNLIGFSDSDWGGSLDDRSLHLVIVSLLVQKKEVELMYIRK